MFIRFILAASCISDPLIGHGRHFGRHGPMPLQHPGIVDERRPTSWRTGEWTGSRLTVEVYWSTISIYCRSWSFVTRQRRERRVFSELLQIVPNHRTRLREVATDAARIADLVRHELSFWQDPSLTALEDPKRCISARSDDTRVWRGPVLDWITPAGQLSIPLCQERQGGSWIPPRSHRCLALSRRMDWSDPSYDFDFMSGISRIYLHYWSPRVKNVDKRWDGCLRWSMPIFWWWVWIRPEDAWKAYSRAISYLCEYSRFEPDPDWFFLVSRFNTCWRL